MEVLSAFETNQWFFLITVFIVIACIGSFLNVVIYRLPVILHNQWRNECTEFLELDNNESTTKEKFSLSFPNSSCPVCGHSIRPWENIPIVSYLLLRGKCSSCSTRISPQYPLVEFITALLSLVVASKLGVSYETLFGLVLTYCLVSLTMIDAKTQLLPDDITLPLLWIGILVNSFGIYTDLQSSIYGAIAGYLSLWIVYKIFKLVTGKEGMGYGDFKLLAVLGAWMGWQMLPQIILLSSLVGTIIGITMMVATRHDKNIPIPFGPYLAIAGWISFLWGVDINRWWLGA